MAFHSVVLIFVSVICIFLLGYIIYNSYTYTDDNNHSAINIKNHVPFSNDDL